MSRRDQHTGWPWTGSGSHCACLDGRFRLPVVMKLIRGMAIAGIAKKLYDESRKPENQERVRRAIDRVKDRRKRSR